MPQLMERTAAHADGEHYADAVAALPHRDPDTGLRWEYDDLLYAIFKDCPDAAAPSGTDEEKTIPFSPKRLTVSTLTALRDAIRRDGFTPTPFRLTARNPDGTTRRYKQTRWVREAYEHQWREQLAAEAATVLPRLAADCPAEGLELEEIVPHLSTCPSRVGQDHNPRADAIHTTNVAAVFRRDLTAAIRQAGWRRAPDVPGQPQRFLPPSLPRPGGGG